MQSSKMKTELPLAEKYPGVQVEKLNTSQQCAFAAIKAKEDCNEKEKLEG